MSAILLVHAWSTQCSACRYGGESWVDSPAKEGKPVLTPEMVGEDCPNCGEEFTSAQLAGRLATGTP